MKPKDTLSEIADFLKKHGRLASAQIFINGTFHQVIPYPENKIFNFPNRKEADTFIHSLTTKKV